MRLEHRFERGRGTPLVFVHGWLGSKDSWRQVRDHLDLDNPKLFYDQRCHGDSACEEFDFEDLADDLHALVERHGLEEPVLIGHSMGGMVALTYAVNHDNLGGLFLLGTCASTPEPEIEDPQFYLDNFHSLERREWAEMIVDNYLGRSDSGRREEEVRVLMEADDEPIVSGLRAMVEYDVREGLEEMETDVEVVAGRHDAAIRDHMTCELADLLDCDRHVLDASHLLLQEVPVEVADLLERFLQRHQ